MYHQLLLANAYMQLAEKNQGEDFKKHSRFLKITFNKVAGIVTTIV